MEAIDTTVRRYIPPAAVSFLAGAAVAVHFEPHYYRIRLTHDHVRVGFHHYRVRGLGTRLSSFRSAATTYAVKNAPFRYLAAFGARLSREVPVFIGFYGCLAG